MADCWTIQMNNTVVGYSGRRGEYIANETETVDIILIGIHLYYK